MTDQALKRCELVIRNARLFDGFDLHPGTVDIGISGDRFVQVSTDPVAASREIDARGRFAIPGLIDSHIHLNDFFNATDEASMERFLAEQLPQNLDCLLAAGVTTIKSVGDPPEYVLRARSRLASGELRGPRLFTTGPCFTAKESHPATTVYGRNPWYRGQAAIETESASQARDDVKRLAALGVDAIKIIQHGGCRCHDKPYYLTIPELHLHAQIFRLPQGIVDAIVDESHRVGLPVTVHTFDEDAAISALEAGADGLEHGVVNQRIGSERLIEFMKRNGASYVPTLWIVDSDITRANLRDIAAAGVRVALGTDSFCGHGTWGVITLLETERMALAGIAPLDVLRAATSAGAAHLRRPDLGAVAAGKVADLVLLDEDPSIDVRALRTASLVIKDGAVMHERENP